MMLMSYALVCVVFLFFKQKTAYEMRISDWSSDVCSSDLPHVEDAGGQCGKKRSDATIEFKRGRRLFDASQERVFRIVQRQKAEHEFQIGRASCRERVCQYV